jgi:hypothetical protein
MLVEGGWIADHTNPDLRAVRRRPLHILNAKSNKRPEIGEFLKMKSPIDLQRESAAFMNVGSPRLADDMLATEPENNHILTEAAQLILTTDEERDVWMCAVGRSQGLAAAVAG